MKKVTKLALLTVLVITAMTYMPADSHAGTQICDYEYYYDAAHTQVSGQCFAACYAGGNYCIGDITEYYAPVNCRVCRPEDP
jgi:hypothetical protein